MTMFASRLVRVPLATTAPTSSLSPFPFLSLLLFLFSLWFISSFLFILHFLVNFDLGFQVDVMASIVLFLVPVMSSALSTRSMMTCFVVNTT